MTSSFIGIVVLSPLRTHRARTGHLPRGDRRLKRDRVILRATENQNQHTTELGSARFLEIRKLHKA